MNHSIDYKKTLNMAERMKTAKIGEYKKWEAIIKKLRNHKDLLPSESEYFSSFSRLYKNSSTTTRSKNYHTRLSKEDEKPPCKTCGVNSDYYCNMNDEYFCTIHVVGHDKNEL